MSYKNCYFEIKAFQISELSIPSERSPSKLLKIIEIWSPVTEPTLVLSNTKYPVLSKGGVFPPLNAALPVQEATPDWTSSLLLYNYTV